ncbi:MAG: SMP-30/gluconolactonase/LRE family protein [Steroidobacteraceae bacterium]
MTALNAELIDTLHVGNTLGEGVLWDPIGERVWWTDIQERRLYRYHPESRALERFATPERLGSFGFVEGSNEIVAAFESGFAFYHPESGRLEWIVRPAHAARNVRFNDGRVDPRGRFWAGSMVEGSGKAHGKLYCLHGRSAAIRLTDVAISNSICFSADGKHLYFADTPHRIIMRYDLDPITGALSNGKAFARTPQGALPDGSIIDSEGHLWNAHWGAGRVVRYAPDGSVSGSIDVPASQPSCMAFGGRALELLFVNSAREGLSAAALAREPQAGDLFIYRVNVRGRSDCRFARQPT